MDKEEILKKSREEHKNRDYVELKAVAEASQFAIKTGVVVCCLIAVLHIALTGRVTYSIWPVYFSILTTISLTKYYKLRRWYDLFVGLLFLAAFIFFLVMFLRNPLGAE